MGRAVGHAYFREHHREMDRTEERDKSIPVQIAHNPPDRRSGEQGLDGEVGRQHGVLPEITRFGLSEEVGRIDRGAYGERNPEPGEPRCDFAISPQAGHKMSGQHRAKGRDENASSHQPALPLGPQEQIEEAPRLFQIPDEQEPGEHQEEPRQKRNAETPPRGRFPEGGGCREHPTKIGAARDRLRPRIGRHPPVPGPIVRNVVGEDGGSRRGRAGISGRVRGRGRVRIRARTRGRTRTRP